MVRQLLREIGITCVTLALVILCGCGQRYPTVHVSGRITRDGKPVPDLHVTFQPRSQGNQAVAGPASVGMTDSKGIFHLRTVGENEMGAVVTEHVVTIVPSSVAFHDSEIDGPPSSPGVLLPKQFSDGSLRFVVPSVGTENADFSIH